MEQPFEITTHTRNNIEWFELFMQSLDKTLSNRGRNIYVIDGSDDAEHEKLLQSNKFGLNVHIIKHNDSDKWFPLFGLEVTSTKHICCVHIDVVFLLLHWDAYIEELLESSTLVGCAERSHTHVEATFTVGRREVYELSKFAHIGNQEHGMISWINREFGEEVKFTKVHRFKERSKWGSLILDTEGRELLYHNFYSARCKEGRSCGIPEGEKVASANLLNNIPFAVSTIKRYLETAWPLGFGQYVDSLPSE